MGSRGYYKGQCKNCLEDCDSTFCSSECQEAWEAGLEDYLEGQREERLLEGRSEADPW